MTRPTDPAVVRDLLDLAETLDSEHLELLRGTPARALLHSFLRSLPECEASIWLRDRKRADLVIVENDGPHRDRLIGIARQPLTGGFVSLVFATQQPMMENSAYRSRSHSPVVDASLGARTEDLIATPLRAFGICVGVISCVRLAKEGRDDRQLDFTVPDLEHVQLCSETLGKLIELEAFRRCVTP